MNPLYPALKRLPFSGFQSSLIADRRGSAIRPATRNPAKGKPLLRQGTDGNFHSGPRVLRIFTFYFLERKARIVIRNLILT
ncbi:MAG: hypothetical protein JRI35_01185 [Deltaproteobacteria bacterium]|nr:hypothetical protein [Deltaproteobacteria bacterium]